MSLWALFLSAFISSTLFPGGSEAVLAYLASDTVHSPWLLLAVASAGNTLGGMTSWGLGRLIAWRYPVDQLAKPRHRQALDWLRRWGAPALLLSWLPLIGDPLCVAAGWLKMHWLLCLILIGVGKTLRYAGVIALFA
ncbi:MAG: DedA family protein [Pseudomonadota bacterium]|nr:MAG: DedA family protein [Pseudomonadota bacterium]